MQKKNSGVICECVCTHTHTRAKVIMWKSEDKRMASVLSIIWVPGIDTDSQVYEASILSTLML